MHSKDELVVQLKQFSSHFLKKPIANNLITNFSLKFKFNNFISIDLSDFNGTNNYCQNPLYVHTLSFSLHYNNKELIFKVFH